MDAALFLLWAKTNRDDRCHPLPCHLLDTAAVALCMGRSPRCRSVVAFLADRFSLSFEDALSWIGFFAALHDVGKAYPHFQFHPNAPEDVKAPLRQAGLGMNPLSEKIPHGTITWAVLAESFSFLEPALDPETVERIARVLGGHHGVFPQSDKKRWLHKIREAEKSKDGSPASWQDLRLSLARHLAEILLPRLVPSPRLPKEDNAAPMVLAGLVSVADWIASNEELFPYRSDCRDFDSYWIYAQEKANEALSQLGWTGWNPPASVVPFTEMFSISTPRPLQEHCIELGRRADRARLVILESPMGEGKTEAALYLQDQWCRARGQGGAYFALPTMAASNQLFERTTRFLKTRYPKDRINFLLLHSHALLNDEYQTIRASSLSLDDDPVAHGLMANEWFTRSKRGLLAPFAVGTVDQTLLSVLQVRHGFVRLFGLAGKTLIFDEVHAYDTYMLTLFERLLQWLAALDTTVVILSATLPAVVRRRLLKAYSGRETRYDDRPYPRATCLHADGSVTVESVPASADRHRTVALEWKEDDAPALRNLIRERLREGGCAVWICNTVNRAQELYLALKEDLEAAGIEVMIFHARFPLGQRFEIETRIVGLFGKDADTEGSPYHRPRRSLLIATQVVEQSLDLDFDWMISELAPIDLILQRTGRLHRHAGRERYGLNHPTLTLLQPDGHGEGNPQFLRTVYEEYILLRTWAALRNKREIGVPQDMEDLIESVYGEEEGNFGDFILQRMQKAKSEMKREMSLRITIAGAKALLEPDNRNFFDQPKRELTDDENPDVHSSMAGLTRYSKNPSVSVVFLEGDETPELSGIPARRDEQIKDYLNRSVNLSYKTVLVDFPKKIIPTDWEKCRMLCFIRVVHLENKTVDLPTRKVILDDEIGCRILYTNKGGEDDVLQSDY